MLQEIAMIARTRCDNDWPAVTERFPTGKLRRNAGSFCGFCLTALAYQCSASTYTNISSTDSNNQLKTKKKKCNAILFNNSKQKCHSSNNSTISSNKNHNKKHNNSTSRNNGSSNNSCDNTKKML